MRTLKSERVGPTLSYVMTFRRNYGKNKMLLQVEDLLNEYLTGKELEIYNIIEV